MTLRLYRFVGESSDKPRSEVSHALGVGQLTSAVAIVELIQVPVQVLGVHVDVCAFETSLQLSEVVLTKVRTVRLVSGVDTSLVVHDVVTSHPTSNGT